MNFFSTMFQSFKVLSSEQESKSWPSQENARSLTGPVWDFKTFDYASMEFVQSLIVRSEDALAIKFPVGLMSIA